VWEGVAGWNRELRVLPDGCVDIAWDGTAVTVTPAADAVRRVPVLAGRTTVGVRLRPVAAGAVLGSLAGELRTPTALRDAWGVDAAERLEQALVESPAEAVVVRLVDRVVQHARGRMPDHRLDAALEELARPWSMVGDAADAAGWSVRQFRRQCVANVGLAPKPLQHVLRFRRALRSLGTQPLARVAAEHGYADQAHLTRAVRRHAAATPGELAARMAR